MTRLFCCRLTLAVFAVHAVDAVAQDPPVRLLVDDINIDLLHNSLPATVLRLDYAATRDILFIMHRNGDIATFDRYTSTYEKVADGSLLGISDPSGFAISPKGDFFVSGNTRDTDGVWVTGFVKRSRLVDSTNVPGVWTTVAETVPYPLSRGFNHLMSAVAVSPDGNWLYINSGSRTDHGEVQDNRGAHPDVREISITSAILRLPADGEGITLYNDADSLAAGGYLFADGVRNHFDLAIGSNGRLFGVENSGDRDDAEELNWIQEGRHYGFPWRLGMHDNPQQFSDYDPEQDPLINPNSSAAALGLFKNDPGFPPHPEGIVFTDPIPNTGPDGVEYRDPVTGVYLDGAVTGASVGSFTPHKSPLGLVFDTAGVLDEPYTGGGFVLGWNQSTADLLSPFTDPGEDLLHLDLEFNAGKTPSYRMNSTRIADTFGMPIDAVLIDTTMYIMEMRFGCLPPPAPCSRMWRIDFPRKPADPPPPPPPTVATEPALEIPTTSRIDVYPDPFTDYLTVSLTLTDRERVRTDLTDVTGRLVLAGRARLLPPGEHTYRVQMHSLPSGLYVLRVTIGHSVLSRVVTLVR